MRRAAVFDNADRHRIVEPARPGAGGIEVANAVDDLVVRQVAVAEDDDVGRLRAERVDDAPVRFPRARQDVRQQNAQAADGGAYDVHPVAIVVVAFDVRQRRERAQFRKHMRAADVAGVHDRLHSAQRFHRLWA